MLKHTIRCMVLAILFVRYTVAHLSPENLAKHRTSRYHRHTVGAKSVADFDDEKLYLEYILDAVTTKEPTQPVIRQWKPNRESIWARYCGTILQTTLVPATAIALLSFVVCMIAKDNPEFFTAMDRLDKMWHMHFSICTFFLAFFLNTAKSAYDSVLSNTRLIQGRLNDLNLLASSGACRDENGVILPKAQEIIATLGRYTQLFSIVFYSSTCRRYKCLTEWQGLQGLEQRGLITSEEREILLQLPPSDRYNAIYTWIISKFTDGCEGEKPCFRMSAEIHHLFVSKVSDLRGACGTIGDILETRCQVSYVHLIQLLVDSFIFITPFAAVAEMRWFSVACSFLLAVFFFGLLDLSKIMYDPLDNDDFGKESDNIQIDTLIQESNNGSQTFFRTGFKIPSSETGSR